MENAAKALVIAGAVLLTILIISSAMLVVFTAQETLDTSKSSMADLQIKAFNEQFEMYQGPNKSSEQVLSLLRTIQSSNIRNEQKVAVKLFGLYSVLSPGVFDTTSYAIFTDSHELRRCNAGGPKISEGEMINIVDRFKNRGFTYNVKLWYCNDYSSRIGNNTHLNPAIGAVLVIDIEKNYKY